MHSVEASSVADHCLIYALSDPTNEEYWRTCNHVHNDSCPQCSQLQTLLSILEQKCSSEQLSEEDRAEILHVFYQAKEDIFGKKKSYFTYVTLLGKTGLNEICVESHFNAFWMRYNALKRIPMILNAFTFSFKQCFFNVLECVSNVVQCIGNASKRFFLTIKLVPEVQTRMRKIIIDWSHWWLDIDTLENVLWKYNFFSGTVMYLHTTVTSAGITTWIRNGKQRLLLFVLTSSNQFA